MLLKKLAVLAALLALLASLPGGAAPLALWTAQPDPPDEEILRRYRADDSVGQLLLVRCGEESRAAVRLYEKEPGQEDWKLRLETEAVLGRNGVGKTLEGDGKTPLGDFGVVCAFGIREDPGTALDYLRVTESTFACSEEGPWYNRIVDTRETGHDCRGEAMFRCAPEYDYGLMIDYNPDCRWPLGSGIFLHCKGAKDSTGGCVAMDEESMRAVLLCAGPGMRVVILG